jgi:hypothetical protein
VIAPLRITPASEYIYYKVNIFARIRFMHLRCSRPVQRSRHSRETAIAPFCFPSAVSAALEGYPHRQAGPEETEALLLFTGVHPSWCNLFLSGSDCWIPSSDDCSVIRFSGNNTLDPVIHASRTHQTSRDYHYLLMPGLPVLMKSQYLSSHVYRLFGIKKRQRMHEVRPFRAPKMAEMILLKSF